MRVRLYPGVFIALLESIVSSLGQTQPTFSHNVIDGTVEGNSHKPKVLAVFSRDGCNDAGSLDRHGFKLYRYTENWKAYTIFTPPGAPQGYEDSSVADINGDGWNDIVLGGWGNITLWAENPAGQGKDPYTTPWKVHIVDKSRFSHEVVAADLNHDGKCDITTTTGVYLQGSTPDDWTFVNIGKGGQGTTVGHVFPKADGVNDVIAVYQKDGKNQIAWFENPAHRSGNAAVGPWIAHIIDANPGGDKSNREADEMAFILGDINGDSRLDLVAASMGEGPDPGDDNRQICDGLVWYEAPADPVNGAWTKHVVDATVGWVHASSIQLADFDGDGHLDICYGEQDQSKSRKDGHPGQQLGIFYNVKGDGLTWSHQVLSKYPGTTPGGFNSRVGIIGKDRLPSIFTSLHGFFGDPNPLILWRNEADPKTGQGSAP